MPKNSKTRKFSAWSKALKLVPEHEQSEWIRRTLRSKKMLHIFGRYFFPKLIQGSNNPPPAHLDLIKELTTRDTSAIVFPREHAKSTWEKIDTLHDIVYNLEPVILYIAATAGDAEFHMGAIKHELETNDDLRHVYGNLVPEFGTMGRIWRNRWIQTINGVNLVARGARKGRGVSIKGQRPTKIVIDDAEDDETVRNPVLRAKFHDWLYLVIIPSLDSERGFVKMIGTALHDLAEVVQFYERHGGIFRRAIENGKSIWPARWSLKKLEAKREEIGTRAFLREYMNQSMPDEEAGIKRLWIEKSYFATLPPEYAYEAIGFLDPQAGESAMADEYALSILYCARGTNHRFLFEQPAGRISQFEQAKEVVRAWLRHKRILRVFGIEKVLNQTSVWQTLQDWKAGNVDFNNDNTPDNEWIDESDRNIPIIAWDPKGRDKVARLQVFEPDFERGEVHIRREHEELRTQLMFIGTGNIDHDDRADSLVGALEVAKSRGMSQERRPQDVGDDKKLYTGTIVGNLMKRRF